MNASNYGNAKFQLKKTDPIKNDSIDLIYAEIDQLEKLKMVT